MTQTSKSGASKTADGDTFRGEGRYIEIADTRLFVEERGLGYPLVVLHGAPGAIDHRFFGNHLDPLCDRYRLIFVDARGQGRSAAAAESTWRFDQFVQDVSALAKAMKLGQYAVLGHSYGAFVALQHAISFPGEAAQTIVSNGVPSTRFLWERVERSLAELQPPELRDQITESWEREKTAQTQEDVARLLHDQMPFHFADPYDPRIPEFEKIASPASYAPAMLRHFANQAYGGFDAEAGLSSINQPVLVLAGRHDRTCSVEAAETIARGVPKSELMIFERSGHLPFVEEQELYIEAARNFLDRHSP
jgi:proline-specific peptidase